MNRFCIINKLTLIFTAGPLIINGRHPWVYKHDKVVGKRQSNQVLWVLDRNENCPPCTRLTFTTELHKHNVNRTVNNIHVEIKKKVVQIWHILQIFRLISQTLTRQHGGRAISHLYIELINSNHLYHVAYVDIEFTWYCAVTEKWRIDNIKKPVLDMPTFDSSCGAEPFTGQQGSWDTEDLSKLHVLSEWFFSYDPKIS